MQIGLYSFTPGVAPNIAILNAGKSRIYGTEVELAVEPFEGFKIQASYAYLNSKLIELAPIDLPPPPFLFNLVVQQPTESKVLPLVPKHKLSAEARYDLPLDDSIGQISLSAIYSYTDKVFVQDVSERNRALLDGPDRQTLLDSADDPTWLPGYGVVNFNLSWNNIAQSGLDANLFMSNAFNKHYAVVHNLSISQGIISRYYGQPRMYGLKLRYNF